MYNIWWKMCLIKVGVTVDFNWRNSECAYSNTYMNGI